MRPLTAGELLDMSVGLARSRFRQLAGTVAPWYVLGASIDVASRPARPETPIRLHLFLLTLTISALAECRLSLEALDILKGRPPDASSYRNALRRRWLAIILGYSLKWLSVIAGFLVLLLTGAYLTTIYFAVPFVSAAENLGVSGARGRSLALSRPHLGRIFASLGLFDLGLSVLSVAMTLASTGGRFSQRQPWSGVASWTLGLLVAPIRAALIAAVYLDCRVRSEGYDLTLSLEPPLPAI